jgi:hypothetical protein
VARKLVLHVGAPKTGSTYLQRRLRANAAALREHGVYVPVLPAVAKMAGNAKLLATVLSTELSLSFIRNFPEIDTAATDPGQVVSELLADWHADRETVVLSAENFRPQHAAPLRKLIPDDVECTVVLFVRRQDRWIESYHNQLIKTDDLYADLASFVAMLCDTDGERFCRPDWFAHYTAWRGAFGNCNVVFYDDVRRDLFAAFMAAAGLTTPPDVVDIDPVQMSLDAHQLAYLLQLDRPIASVEFVRRRAATAEASRLLGAPTYSFLSAADRARLRERFEPSNRRLLNELGRSAADSPLDMASGVETPWRLADLYASAAYIAHRTLADAIYAAQLAKDLGYPQLSNA